MYQLTEYFERASLALAAFRGSLLSWSNWNLDICFCGGRKTGELGDKPSEQSENQQQAKLTHETGPESNLGHTWCEPLSPLRHSRSPKFPGVHRGFQISRQNADSARLQPRFLDFEKKCSNMNEELNILFNSRGKLYLNVEKIVKQELEIHKRRRKQALDIARFIKQDFSRQSE